MDKENKNIPQTEHDRPEQNTSSTKRRGPAIAWVALALAVIAWVILMWGRDTGTGYIALAIAALGVAAGFWGASGSRPATRRLAIAAIIASAVLVVVLASFIIVIELGMN